MRKISLKFVFSFFFAILFFPHVTHAAVAREYSGCFERPHTAGAEYQGVVWMRSLTCTITLANTSDSTIEHTLTVENLDPTFFTVTTSSGQTPTVTRSDTQMSIALTLAGTTPEIITLSHWDNNPTDDDYWFVALSDPQTQPEQTAPNPIFVRVMNEVDIVRPPFTTVSGDLLKGNESNPQAHADEYVLQDSVYRSFHGSSFVVPGDHDARQPLEQYYAALYGERHSVFTYGNTDFFGINTVETLATEGEISDEEFAWLESQLAASQARHKIVFLQHPLIPPDWANSTGIDEPYRRPLAELLVQYGVELIMVGDAHGYDYQYIDAQDFPGLEGGFYQLDAAGAGGKYSNYDGSHFFVLVHISNTGIEVQRIDEDLFAVSVELAEGQLNDGTESTINVTVENSGDVDLPFLRVPIHLAADGQEDRLETFMVSSDDGTFYPLTAQIIDGVLHGYIEIEVPIDTSVTFTAGQQRTILQGIANTVDTDGVINFSTLPTAENIPAELSVLTAEKPTTVNVLAWDVVANQREWKEKTAKGSSTTFSAFGLQPLTQYDIHEGNILINRIATDENGTLAFTYKSKKTERTYQIVPTHKITPTAFGTLPMNGGGPHFQSFGNSNGQYSSFFVYDKDLSHGFESIWIDSNGDGILEVATVPHAGAVGHVRLFGQDGKSKDGVFPYGETFTSGIQLVAADVNGDGKQELIVAPQADKRALVKVYEWNDEKELQLLDTIRTHDALYEGGIHMASGDIDGDGDDEIIVAPRTEQRTIKILRWAPKKNEMRVWLTKEFRGEGDGVFVAAGDVTFNGRYEILAGPRTGGSMVFVYTYQPKKNSLRLSARQRVFSDSFAGGVELFTGNIDTSPHEEVIVTQHGDTSQGRMHVFAVKKQSKTLQKRASLFPFGKEFSGDVSLTLSDVNADWKNEVIIARQEGESTVKLYEYQKNTFANLDSYDVYDTEFIGGVSLTQ